MLLFSTRSPHVLHKLPPNAGVRLLEDGGLRALSSLFEARGFSFPTPRETWERQQMKRPAIRGSFKEARRLPLFVTLCALF